ncbi:MAG TPA: hypothetical protein PLE94_08545, partial [Thermotogota bacterium]|nr:hypothetical protein [Thermotogota bacterium]
MTKRRTFPLFGLFLICLALTLWPQSNLPASEPAKETVDWPVRFDTFLGSYLIAQIPFSIGLPFDFGFGFTHEAPLGGLYAYGQYVREKKVLFAKQLIEQRQIKMFLGISTDLVYEVKYTHYFSDTLDVRKVPILNQHTTLLAFLASYKVRFLGTASRPSFLSDGFLKTGVGPYEVNMFYFSAWRIGSFDLSADLGIHILDYSPFSIAIGEIIGVGGLLYVEKEKRFSPRLVFGFVPERGVPGIGVMFHQEIPIGETTLEIGTTFVFPFSGEGYWQVQGEWKHPGDHALTFAASPKNLYLGGRWLITLPKIF